MYTGQNKHVVIFNFACDIKSMNIYQPIANMMMNSIKVSPKTSFPEYSPSSQKGPRKRQTANDVLEMQKKNKGKETTPTTK